MTSPDERLQQIERSLFLRDAKKLAEVARELDAQLRDARAEIERLSDRDHWRTEWEDADAKRITAEHELAAERAKVERVEAIAREAIDNIVSGHSTHWDSTMQYGAGCEQCKHERTVRDRLRSALTGEAAGPCE